MIRVLIAVLVALGLTAGLSGCGKKANLKPPPGAEDIKPRQYPR